MPKNYAHRSTKRALSAYEKRALPTVAGRALILPGEPETEAEELVSAGFSPLSIVGVERKEDLYWRLRSHYFDRLMLFHDDVETFMQRATAGAYSYIHLDYTGHFSRDLLANLAGWQRILAPTARVRISVCRGRRKSAQYDFEEQLFRDIVLSWCQFGANNDRDDMFRWIDYEAALTTLTEDTPILLAMLLILQLTFGIEDVRQFTDGLRLTGPFVPIVEGAHRVTNVHRFSYTEPNSPNFMYTVWFDAVPLEISSAQRVDEMWSLRYLADLFQHLAYTTPSFAPLLERNDP